jgi:hypothetical protein
MKQKLNSLVAVFCYSPFVYLISYYAFYISATVTLGRMPTYNNPDPSLLRMPIFLKVVIISFDVFLIGTALLALLGLIAFLTKRLHVSAKHWLFFLGGILMVFFNLFLDPTMKWFAD